MSVGIRDGSVAAPHTIAPQEHHMRNWFNTLNEALEAEGLLAAWDCTARPLGYGDVRTWTWDDGSKYGRSISIYRNECGHYERPVHYAR